MKCKTGANLTMWMGEQAAKTTPVGSKPLCILAAQEEGTRLEGRKQAGARACVRRGWRAGGRAREGVCLSVCLSVFLSIRVSLSGSLSVTACGTLRRAALCESRAATGL